MSKARLKKIKCIAMTLKIKCIVISVATIVLFLVALQLYKEQNKVAFDTYENTLYEYKFAPSISYEVKVKPNTIYPDSILGEDKTYTRELLEYVNITFRQDFSASTPTPLEGAYQIYVEVRGYNQKEEEKQTVWSRRYEKVPVTPVKNEEATYSIEKSVRLTAADFVQYEAFIEEAKEVTKIKPAAEIAVYMIGELSGSVAEGSIQSSFSQEVLIPIGGETFTITKIAGEPVEEQFTETISTLIPIDQQKIILYSSILGVGLVGIILLLICTRPLTEVEIHGKKLRNIVKNYIARMVAVEEISEDKFMIIYYIATIQDLMKVADELQKTVVYQAVEKIEDITKFYVIDKSTIYIYQVSVRQDKQEITELSADENKIVAMDLLKDEEMDRE